MGKFIIYYQYENEEFKLLRGIHSISEKKRKTKVEDKKLNDFLDFLKDNWVEFLKSFQLIL